MRNKPDPPSDPFATPTPTAFPRAGGASGLDALSDEEMAALANQLFGIHTTTSSGNGQRGTSGQSGCPARDSQKSGVYFKDKYFMFGHAVFYGSNDYKNLKTNHTVSVGGPASINMVVDYGAGRQKKTYKANLGGPYYVDAQSYLWGGYYVYEPSCETDPRPFSGSINNSGSVSITVSGCPNSGGTGLIDSRAANYSPSPTPIPPTATPTQTPTQNATPTPTPTPTVTLTPTRTPDPNPPARPTGLTAMASSTSISLDWDDAENATAYVVYQYAKNVDHGLLPYNSYTISFSSSSAVVGNLSEKQVYGYYVASRKGKDLYSAWSEPVIATTTESTPVPPTYTPAPPADTPVPKPAPPADTPTPTPPASAPTYTPTSAPIPTATPTATSTPAYVVSITKTLPGVTSMYLEWNTTGWSGNKPPPAEVKWCKPRRIIILPLPDDCDEDDKAGKRTSYLVTGLKKDSEYKFTVSVNVSTTTPEIWKRSVERKYKTHPSPSLSDTIPNRVPESGSITLNIAPTVTSHQFAIEVQKRTGLEVNSKCTWAISPTPTPAWNGGQSHTLSVSRCGVGDGSSKVVAKVRDTTPTPAFGTSSETEYFSQAISQAWHQIDNKVAYKVGVIPTPGPSGTPVPSLSNAITIAASIWNDRALGIKICVKGGCGSGLDGYATTIKIVDKIDTLGCGNAVACHIPTTGGLPHMGNSDIEIENPPAEPGGSKTWSDNVEEARRDAAATFYLPVYIAHELGHDAGLMHHPSGRHLMLVPNSVIGADEPGKTPIPTLSDLMSQDDKDAMESSIATMRLINKMIK